MANVRIDDIESSATVGQTLFQVADAVDVRIPTSCLGQGKCRECLVEVTAGMELLSPRSSAEAHLGDLFRLSCQTSLTADEGTVECHTLRRGSIRIEDSATDLPCIAGKTTVDPCVTRDGDRILLDGEEIERSTGPIHGVAVDLGTTTVVMRLVDLDTGRVLATQSFENPQRFGGSDVLARVKYDTDHKGKLLRRTLLGYMTHALEDFDVDLQSIYEMTIAGNAAMRDIFFGLNVYSIGQMPYRSITEHEYLEGKRESTSLALSGKRARLPIHPRARVYGLPLVGCHVGADTAACLLAIDIANEPRTVALMDIGTNTELVIGNRDRLHAASCPAGPAFEGGALNCGMPGLEGAIERVRIGDDGSTTCGVIGDGHPTGICGSGLIDLLSEMLRTGAMNRLGRIDDEEGRFTIDATHNIYVTEEDISQLAQAKAANVSGLHIVHQNYGIDFDDVEVFYLAGGFARHLNLDAARNIGLIPNLSDEKIIQVGNASLEGATLALISQSKRASLESLVKTIEHIELVSFPEFFHYFAEGVQFASFDDESLQQEIIL